MRCPYLICHGGYDVLGVTQARDPAPEQTYEYAKAHGVEVTLKLVGAEETARSLPRS